MTTCPTTQEPNAGAVEAPVDVDPRSERVRRAVLDAGVSLLFERGPDGVTPAAVASGARISRTTLYKYWPTRADLLLDVLEAVEPHPEIEPQGDVRADLLAMLSIYASKMNDAESRKVFSSMLAQAQWDADSREVQLKMEEFALENLGRVVDVAVEHGQLPAGIDVRREVSDLLGPMLFRVLVLRDEVTTDDIERFVDRWLAAVRS